MKKTNYAKYAIAAPIVFAPLVVFFLTYLDSNSFPQIMGWRIFAAALTFVVAIIFYMFLKKKVTSV